ncbi:nose resistant to fluoxetine protein 6-like isoform X2 [Adelges cooleyi]|uniref:nose resistant to fluoxetine protein 6-like isoform X2 n=1 Tax=Adelges cooleyi TaxID=133065 RepID=UPI00217FFDC8|nr:nose resistant to fluoxetine protein 6-like isoform X2 [Adelges cooleyi]
MLKYTILSVTFDRGDFQQQRWVTKTLADALDNYLPDGGQLCERHGQTYREGLKDFKLWATRMYDSSSKFPTGILAGRSFDFGHFDECLETDTTGLGFQPQYCIVNIRFSPSPRLYPDFYNTSSPKSSPNVSAWEATKFDPNPAKIQRNEINTAICVPSSCTPSELQNSLSSKVITAFAEQSIDAYVTVNPVYCTSPDHQPPKLFGYKIFWGFVLFIVGITIVGTLYDVFTLKENQSKLKTFFVIFSFKANTDRLFLANSKSEDLSGINFIKTYACITVILGHRLIYTVGQPLHNPKNVEETADQWSHALQRNGALIVDMFFVISGFLTFHFLYEELTKTKKFNLTMLLIWRWLRVMPLYGLLIAFHTFVLAHLTNGPLWKKLAVRESEYCQQNWWTNVLFLNNYVNSNRPCMIQSWYLACDMHFFIAGVLLVYFAWKYQRYSVYAMLVVIFISCLIPTFVVYRNHFYPTFMNYISTLNHLPDHRSYTELYIPSHTRSTPYFVGLFAAYVYRYLRLDKPKFQFPCPNVLLALLSISCALLFLTVHVFYMYKYNLWMSIFYALTFRLIFAAITSAIILIFAVNKIKGCLTNVFVPLGKLTYGAYLGGLTMQLLQVASVRSPTYFNPKLTLWYAIADIVVGFIVAFFLYTLIESPFDTLLKQLIPNASTGSGKMRSRPNPNVSRNIKMAPQ